MFGLFSRAPRRAVPARPVSRRPMLEKLEDRDCPSTITLSAHLTSTMNWVTLTGQVTNTTSPGGLTVQISGVLSGTATTGPDGSFMTMVQGTTLGTVYAATTDGQSNTAQTVLTDPAPTITAFTWSEYPGDMFIFTGHVAGGYQGETVNFGGLKDLQGKTATLDANGNFSVYAMLDGHMDDNGNATAQTAGDVWGTTSNLATSWVSQC